MRTQAKQKENFNQYFPPAVRCLNGLECAYGQQALATYWVVVRRKDLLLWKHGPAAAKALVLSALFQSQIQSTAPYEILGGMLPPSQPGPVQQEMLLGILHLTCNSLNCSPKTELIGVKPCDSSNPSFCLALTGSLHLCSV